MKKFYAVKKGIKPGIYETWDECKSQINGFKGAEYKSFPSLTEARCYMGDETEQISEFPDMMGYDAIAYTDGSYNLKTGISGYGFVVFVNNGERILKVESSGIEESPDANQMRNIAGEILAAKEVVKLAKSYGAKKVLIRHDYIGVAAWPNGDWCCGNVFSF